ncbi:peptidoglycan-binding domain-containing protein [Limibacillus sp. MBR-115]|uniref:peptidoglycan-binding domain-containing protein n=1 Tax=Limibacillus sp. MBR-115 TaxID=3156465 RepID=UPI003393E1DD
MLRKSHTALVAVLTAGSLLAYSATGAPAFAQTAGSGYVQIAAAYSQVVQNVQYSLNQAGYNAGPVDGLMGSRSRSAIEAYQRANGLLVTGQPSQSLMEHISASSMTQQTVPQSTSVSGQTIVEIQSALRERGYDISAINGRMNEETAAAIRAYQNNSNLTITGQASDDLLANLRYQAQQAVPQSTVASKKMIIDIQSELRRRGYEISVVNGEMDEETAAAIRAYQEDSDLKVTGKATNDLLANLRYQDQQTQQDYSSYVRDVQQSLNARGYSAGPADGVMGPSTRNAIRTFQVDAGDEVSGRVDRQLLNRLDIVVADSGTGDQGESVNGNKREYVPVLSENFTDGNYTKNPTWNVFQGTFRVDNQRVLRSYVKTNLAQPNTIPQRTGDASKDLLFSVLEQAFQREGRGSQVDNGPTQAKIGTEVPIHNAFRMRMRVDVNSNDGRFVFGPYQNGVSNGYLLAYSIDNGYPAFRLLSVTRGKTQLVAEASDVPNLNDGKVHQIDWRRNLDGRMEAGIDGVSLLRTKSNTYRNDFDGFTFTNLGGDFGVRQILVEDRNRDLSSADSPQQ